MRDTPVRPNGITGSPELDEALLVRTAQADPLAFEQLYHRYLDRVYAYIRSRTSSEAEAGDLTQQVFVQALDALPRYRGRGTTFAAWLFRIARNKVIDSHRRRRPTVSWDRIPESLHPHDRHDPEADLLRHEALDRLCTLVSALDADAQELLALRFAAHLTIAEIAAIVGKSAAATQRQLHRTIRRLKEQYHDETP